MGGLSAHLAEWAEGFTLDDAPQEVVADARLRILDIMGVMIASAAHETVAAARRAQAEADGGRGVRPLLDGDETSIAGAAFINGVASAVLEFDDTHIATNIHPTGVIVAATLPIAQARGLTGRQWLESVIVGSEILCRLGLVSPVRMHEVGLHPTSVYGVFGAAYAVAKLRQLDAQTMADAVGTAASLSAGSIASFEDGTATKTLHVGFAAASAVRAVALAAEGISGPARVFEGKFGWYGSYIQSRPDFRFAALTDGLGEHWHSLDIATKLYPCAYTLMPFITAALALRKQCAIDPAEIREIRCAIMPRSFRTVCEPLEEKRRPLTSWHGRISLQHTVAEALALGRFDKNSYAEESLRNPLINALADKVVHVADPIAAGDLSRSRGEVTIVFNDGRELCHTVEDMIGTARNPATEAVYVDKFRANVDGVIPVGMAEDIMGSILALERLDDVGGMVARLRREAASTR
ncbi:MmgE/PrpD family protein [Chelatococcus asaccharovorans]|uniref:2-methylcitrate dehydratase PrpD n=1 Tax=Chelatococcus asaccharovorans TaxID=28210 RepID=A0A2V3U710_9HYPH|nr:MmgE/PrpD family protein [Chelatococcus asaccharovorans]MBS7705034.1 MmgE/PrpD family protein [Chelatococcus asaccharovorans]PXW53524.1 2-methylcitrate dehydratase PrpD [Chelatococcus asaccharovorans]